MSIKRPGSGSQTISDLRFALPSGPLGGGELTLVRDRMSDIAPEWSVELHGICAEETTLVLLPEDGDDAMGPGFMISRESYGFHLDQVHWDEVTDLGVFGSLHEVVATVAARLAFFLDMAVPVSATMH
jgi:hypothetical protein